MNATDVTVIVTSVATLTGVVTGIARLIGHASRTEAATEELRQDVTELKSHVQRIEQRQWDAMTPERQRHSRES